jgi:TM2 domain-containing membrane protein YozV
VLTASAEGAVKPAASPPQGEEVVRRKRPPEPEEEDEEEPVRPVRKKAVTPSSEEGEEEQPPEEEEYEERQREPKRSRQKKDKEKYCQECGAIILAKAVTCPKCGVEQSVMNGGSSRRESNRIGAGVCALLIGGLGIHKFIMGLPGAGVTMLLVTVIGAVVGSFGACLVIPLVALFGPVVMGIIGFIEGIIYLSKSDEQFYQDYVVKKKGWF